MVEYFIQNDVSEAVKEEVGNVAGGSARQPEYPNMYILPKKYTSASEVKIAEVIRSFPLRVAD